jgi:hypothetical protein
MADIEVTRLVADVEVDAGEADTELEKTAALEDEVARDRHGKITMDLPDPARLAATGAALGVIREQTGALMSMATGTRGGGGGTAFVPVPLGGGGGGGNIIIPAAAAAAGGGGEGGGGGVLAGLMTKAGAQKMLGSKGALAALLGVGAAAGVGGLGAGFGTLGSFLGFGAEHVIGSAIGTAGSIAGGVLGGGLLGLGAAGVTGVGMATDLAGIGQASGDIKTTYQALNQLQSVQQQFGPLAPLLQKATAAQQAYNKTVQQYGVNSQQAFVAQTNLTQAQSQYQSAVSASASAQQNLNTVLSSFSPLARGAVLQAAATAIQFKTLFDQYTGAAEATGANIITQIMQVAEKFLPIIGKFADENMKIIQAGLQPLFTWIQGPGMKIFIDLERIFQKNLPYALGAFVNGIELLAKTIDQAAQYTGRFMQWLDRFFTRMNTTDYKKWHQGVKTLIDLFYVWAGVVVQLFKVIVDVFKPAVGFGAAFGRELTRGLKAIDDWLRSTKVFDALHELMTAHKSEFLDGLANVIKALAPLVAGLLLDFIKIQTIGAGWGTKMLNEFAKFINYIDRHKALAGFLSMAGAFGMFATGAAAAFKIMAFGMSKVIGFFGPLLSGIKLLSSALLGLELSTGWAAVILIAFVLIAAAAYELTKHWKQVWTDIKNWFDDAMRFLRSGFGTLILLILGPIGALAILALHWQQIWRDMVGAFDWVLRELAKFWDHVQRDFRNWIHNAENFGKDLVHGIIHGMESIPVVGPIFKFGTSLLGHLGSALGIGSPSKLSQPMGADVVKGLMVGMESQAGASATAAAAIAQDILNAFSKVGGTKGASQDIKNLSGIFGDLSKMFTSIQKSSSALSSGDVVSQLDSMNAALYTLGPAIQNLFKGIDSIYVSSSMYGASPVGVTNLTRDLNDVGKMFRAINSAVGGISKFNPALLTALEIDLAIVAGHIATISSLLGGISNLMQGQAPKVVGWKDLYTPIMAGGFPKMRAADVSKLGGIFDTIRHLFTSIRMASSATANFNVGALTALEADLAAVAFHIATISTILGAIQQIMEGGGGQIVGWSGLYTPIKTAKYPKLDSSKISSLTGTFNTITGLFNAVGKTTKAAGNVTTGGLQGITVDVAAIAAIVGKLAGAVTSATPGVMNSFTTLGTKISNYFTLTLIPQMKTWGTQMMTNLATGITMGAPAVGNVMTFAGAAGAAKFGTAMNTGLSNTYYIESVQVGANNPAQFGLQMQQQSRLANATGGSKRAGS